jgi:hypothetical protein
VLAAVLNLRVQVAHAIQFLFVHGPGPGSLAGRRCAEAISYHTFHLGML